MTHFTCRFGAFLLPLLLVAPASGQGPLEWKFKEGDTFYVESVSTLKQKMKVGEREFGQELEQASVVSYTVKKKSESDKSVVLEQKFEGMRFRGTTSAEPEEKFADKLKGSILLFTLNDKLEVTKVEGYGELVKNLAGDDPAQQKMVQLVLSEDAVRKSAGDLFNFLPGKAVEKGAKWERSATTPLGPLGSLAVKNNYTYEGKDTADGKPVDSLTFTSTATYELPKAGPADAAATMKVTKADLKAEDGKGKILFDAAAGRLVEAEARIRIKGPVTISVLNSAVDTVLEQETVVKTRVLEKNPIAK